jgi:predicted transcriptional regulator
MSTKLVIALIERGLRKKRVSVNSVCRRANVDRSTWHRWKNGDTEPNVKTWRRVVRALPEDVRPAA